jgi:hypothetical protein
MFDAAMQLSMALKEISEPRPPQSAQIFFHVALESDVLTSVVVTKLSRLTSTVPLPVRRLSRIELERFVLATTTAYETVPLFEVAVHVLAAFAAPSAPVAVFVHVMFVSSSPRR